MALNGNTGLASPPNGQKESFFSHLRKRARQGAAIPTATLSLKSQEMKRRGPRESHEGAEAQRALPRKRLKNISHVAPPQHMGHHGGMGGHGGGRMSGSGGVVPLRAGDWKCGSEGCGYHNFAKNVSCLRCGASRAGADGAYAHDASGTSAIHRGRLNASRSLYTEPQYELLQPHERKRVGGKRQKSRNLKYSDHTRSSFTNAPIPPRPLRSYHDSLAGRPW
ncbi:hypothetical protein L207DRAFT_348219 [Hyaloscypha variabilis F]|uniref:RanBP2-type domain-containing protein n=1 Tax=Hyaloscypha variabilis (strain UAMH 11265 / GT02V1 / F) TaxID=1149755 RepID=A0A2J6RR60_HYAVF|nr:hypothetical protein L207DRAFT_348219 [Hyaloscypha variabilis F]